MKSRVSINDVAKRANVSIATVSNVINGKGRVSESTVERINNIIAELGYIPSISARNLKQKQSHLIGVIVPFQKTGSLKDNPFYWDLVAGIENGARDSKFHVILTGVVDGEEAFTFAKERHLDGVIVVGAHDGSSTVEQVKKLGIPAVFMDSYLSDESLYQVLLDDEEGGYLAAKYLLENNHSNISVISGKVKDSRVSFKRLEGVKRAFMEKGLTFNPNFLVEGPVSMAGGLKATNTILKSKCSAVLCFSDVVSLGLIRGLQSNGYQVPDDISVVGFDDLYFTQYTTPTITTIQQDIVEKGRVAVDLIIKQLNNEPIQSKKTVLNTKLIERESTRTI
ncbi:LacI family DNA-binding transcriptional regulator [Sutcliffiella cohnii]|uniref:LacI family DNA-binding transcriptional regulator n=1 Tax=Sutcliffiella cohnii TaxID=33932 RepID=UPI002E250D08|nr:LacI family DNA-binding transcriptional regulator [Sutcliffiella cohnii]